MESINVKDLYTKLNEQYFKLGLKKVDGVARGPIVEETKNILYNNIDSIVCALKMAAEASEQIHVLEVELDDAERELDERDASIEALTKQIEGENGQEDKKTTNKKQTKPVVAANGK